MLEKLKIFDGRYKTMSDLIYSRRPAFSLIEIMVALFIISLGMTAILSLIGQNLNSQSYNRSNLIAYQLAQEGMELIRRVRDTNWRNNLSYNFGLPGDTTYYMDYNDTFPIILNSDNGADLLRQDASGFYQHGLESTATSSGFSRSIYIKEEIIDRLLIRVTVTWQEREKSRSYVLENYLYDWKKKL